MTCFLNLNSSITITGLRSLTTTLLFAVLLFAANSETMSAATVTDAYPALENGDPAEESQPEA